MFFNLTDSHTDIIAGTAAGITNIAISHPLDTVKVRMQLAKNPVPIHTLLG